MAQNRFCWGSVKLLIKTNGRQWDVTHSITYERIAHPTCHPSATNIFMLGNMCSNFKFKQISGSPRNVELVMLKQKEYFGQN